MRADPVPRASPGAPREWHHCPRARTQIYRAHAVSQLTSHCDLETTLTASGADARKCKIHPPLRPTITLRELRSEEWGQPWPRLVRQRRREVLPVVGRRQVTQARVLARHIAGGPPLVITSSNARLHMSMAWSLRVMLPSAHTVKNRGTPRPRLQ